MLGRLRKGTLRNFGAVVDQLVVELEEKRQAVSEPPSDRAAITLGAASDFIALLGRRVKADVSRELAFLRFRHSVNLEELKACQ